MKSPSLYVLAVAFLSAPLFMGQAGPSLKGGGGCGCSDAKDETTAINAGDAVVGDAATGDGTIAPTDTASDDATGDTTTEETGNTPPPVNTCEVADASASVLAKEWSQDVESSIGMPVNDECKAECGGTGDNTPWSLSIHLSGSLLSEASSYSFSFMKDEFKDKVRYLEAKRDTVDPDGCPKEGEDPCWRTCTEGECLAVDAPIKSETVLLKEGKDLALNYLTKVCKLELKAEDLDAVDWDKRIQTAFEKISLTDAIQCTQGVVTTATQVVPWAEQILKAGLVRDEKGAPYTADQIFKCAKKSMLK